MIDEELAIEGWNDNRLPALFLPWLFLHEALLLAVKKQPRRNREPTIR